jgi:hypothetical protein
MKMGVLAGTSCLECASLRWENLSEKVDWRSTERCRELTRKLASESVVAWLWSYLMGLQNSDRGAKVNRGAWTHVLKYNWKDFRFQSLATFGILTLLAIVSLFEFAHREVICERRQSKRSGFIWDLQLDPNCINVLKISCYRMISSLLAKARICHRQHLKTLTSDRHQIDQTWLWTRSETDKTNGRRWLPDSISITNVFSIFRSGCAPLSWGTWPKEMTS